MTSALQTHEEDQIALSSAQQKLAQHEKITLEKVASLQKYALDTNRIPELISTMVDLRLVTPIEGEKIASRLKEEPNALFDLFTKVADSLANPGDGQEFLDTLDRRVEDPDGWFTPRK